MIDDADAFYNCEFAFGYIFSVVLRSRPARPEPLDRLGSSRRGIGEHPFQLGQILQKGGTPGPSRAAKRAGSSASPLLFQLHESGLLQYGKMPIEIPVGQCTQLFQIGK